jgi:hypothetical protein
MKLALAAAALIFTRIAGVTAGNGDSSITFWWRR